MTLTTRQQETVDAIMAGAVTSTGGTDAQALYGPEAETYVVATAHPHASGYPALGEKLVGFGDTRDGALDDLRCAVAEEVLGADG